MKRVFILLILLLVIAGCDANKEFNPTVTQVIHEIEVNKDYDPMSFIRDVSNEDYAIAVIDNEINISQVGNYYISYQVCNEKDQCVEVRYLVAVVDETKPTIHLISDITTTVNKEFDLSHFVYVEDNYDANLNNKLEIIGDYDIHTIGEYQVQLKVTDTSNNTAVRTVTIYVMEDETTTEDTNESSVVGLYKVYYLDEDEYNPTLVLTADESYSLVINYCVGLRTFTGTYTVNGKNIILETDGLTFDDDDPSSSTITLTINDDGSLTYENSYGACSPIRKDIFVKQ